MAYSMAKPYATTMKFMNRLSLIAGLLACAPLAPAAARERDQSSAYEMRRQGQVMPLRKAMIVPRIEASGATYLRSSPEFDERRLTYRLKFQREYRVFWIEVDARNGREIARSGR